MSYVMTKKADFDITSMQVVCFDAYPDENWIKSVRNASYTDMDTLLRTSDFISIHVPLLPSTHHLIDEEAFSKMKTDVILVNTSRGEIVHIPSLIKALEAKKLWGVALDVFEGEKKYIFHDQSSAGFRDNPDLGKLANFEHCILSSHIAFYTDQAVEQVTAKTLSNYQGFLGKEPKDEKAF